MALKTVVDDLETVPEALRNEYTKQDDGKYYLSVEDIDNHPSLAGLKSALGKERGSRGALEKEVKAWKSLGKTPEEIAEMVAAVEETERKKAEAAGDHAKILKQHQDSWAKEKASLEAELNAARSSERGAVVGERLLGALSKAGATEEGAELLPDRLANRIKFETIDGKRVLKIMAADGETPLAGKGADGAATLDDLVVEAKTKYPSLFKGSGAGGSGKQPDHNAGGTGITRKSDLKTEKDRAAYVEKNGLDAYKSLSDR